MKTLTINNVTAADIDKGVGLLPTNLPDREAAVRAVMGEQR